MMKRFLFATSCLLLPAVVHAQSTSLLTIMGPTLKYDPATGRMDVQPGTQAGMARDAAAAIAAEQAAQQAAAAAQATAQGAIPASTMGHANGPAQLDANGLLGGSKVQPSGAQAPRTLAERLGDTLSIFDFADADGAAARCNGTYDDSVAVAAAEASGVRVNVPSGVTCYAPAVSQTAMAGVFVGGGQIVTSVNNGTATSPRGPQYSAVRLAPNASAWDQTNSAEDNCAAGFPCWAKFDYSHTLSAEEYHISGAATLGQPAANYESMPGTQAHNLFIDNSSGWNQSHNSNNGRTGSGAYSTVLLQNGAGDFGVFGAHVQCSGTVGPGDGNKTAGPDGTIINGYTDWLAVPECGFIGATEDAYSPGQYMQLGEFAVSDHGNDVSAIGYVRGYDRTATTAKINNRWIDELVTCNLNISYTLACDAVQEIGGAWTIGHSFIGATVTAPLAMQAGQKIALNGSIGSSAYAEGNPPSKYNLGGDYITDDSYSVFIYQNGGAVVRMDNQPNAVNWWEMTGSATGGAVSFAPQGADATIAAVVRDKGGAGVILQSNGANVAKVSPSGLQVFVSTVANLGTCNSANEGTRTGVTDALSPTFLSPLTGGGSVHSPAYCNGTAWVAG